MFKEKRVQFFASYSKKKGSILCVIFEEKGYYSLRHIWKRSILWVKQKRVQVFEKYIFKVNSLSHIWKKFNSVSHIWKSSFLRVTQKRFNSLSHFQKKAQFFAAKRQKVQFVASSKKKGSIHWVFKKKKKQFFESNKKRVQFFESYFFQKKVWVIFSKKNSLRHNFKRSFKSASHQKKVQFFESI